MEYDDRIETVLEVGEPKEIHPIPILIAIIADDMIHHKIQDDEQYKFLLFFAWQFFDDRKANVSRDWDDYKALYNKEKDDLSITTEKGMARKYVSASSTKNLPQDFPSIFKAVAHEYTISSKFTWRLFLTSVAIYLVFVGMIESWDFSAKNTNVFMQIIETIGLVIVPATITLLGNKTRTPYTTVPFWKNKA